MKKAWIAGLAACALLMDQATAGLALAQPRSERIINGSIRVDRQLETEFPAMVRLCRRARC